MKKVSLSLALAALCLGSGCVASRTASKMIDPDVIKALALDTNTVELTIIAPTFGTLVYKRNLPASK